MLENNKPPTIRVRSNQAISRMFKPLKSRSKIVQAAPISRLMQDPLQTSKRGVLKITAPTITKILRASYRSLYRQACKNRALGIIPRAPLKSAKELISPFGGASLPLTRTIKYLCFSIRYTPKRSQRKTKTTCLIRWSTELK